MDEPAKSKPQDSTKDEMPTRDCVDTPRLAPAAPAPGEVESEKQLPGVLPERNLKKNLGCG
jgi:hypothetical protein